MGSSKVTPETTGTDNLRDSQQQVVVRAILSAETTERTRSSMKPIQAWQSAAVFLTVLGCMVAFILLFTGMGQGAWVFTQLHSLTSIKWFFLAAAGCLSIMLYVFDASYWHTALGKVLRRSGIAAAILSVVVAGIFAAKDYPATSLMFFFVGIPVVFYALRLVLFRNIKTADYMRAMSASLLLVGTAIGVWFVCWVLIEDKIWTDSIRLEFMRDMRCFKDDVPDQFLSKYRCDLQTSPPGCKNSCTAAFLLWFSPFLMTAGSLVFGIVCYILSMIMAREGIKQASYLAQCLVGVLSGMAFCVWCAAAVAGSAGSLADVVTAFAFAGFIAIAIMVASIIGLETLKTTLGGIPIIKDIGSHWVADWLKAFTVMSCWPCVPVLLALSGMNQLFRKLCPCTKNIEKGNDEWQAVYTLAVSNLKISVNKWNWRSVCVKMIWLGGVYMGMNVGVGKLCNLFFSFLIQLFKDLSLGVLTIVFALVGATMFLLPPVPGPPVYLTGAVLLTGKAESTFNSFWAAVFFVSVICLCVKLCASAMQQKVIGEQLSSKVAVRNLIGVNSVTTRAIKKLLQTPGLNLPKVCILCGGPDWPVSVCCGVLKCKLSEIMIGTIPVYALILPMVMTGAFQLKANEGGIWTAMGNISTGIGGLIMAAMALGSFHYISKTIKNHKDEIMEEPLDEEVSKFEERSTKKKEAYDEISHWEVLPTSMRVVVATSASLMATSVYMVVFGSSYCFRTFTITSIISDPYDAGGLDGNAANLLIAPFGHTAVFLFLGSLLLLQVFNQWIGSKIKHQLQNS